MARRWRLQARQHSVQALGGKLGVGDGLACRDRIGREQRIERLGALLAAACSAAAMAASVSVTRQPAARR